MDKTMVGREMHKMPSRSQATTTQTTKHKNTKHKTKHKNTKT